MTITNIQNNSASFGSEIPLLEKLGLKLSRVSTHINRTITSTEIGSFLAAVPQGGGSPDYRTAVTTPNLQRLHARLFVRVQTSDSDVINVSPERRRSPI